MLSLYKPRTIIHLAAHVGGIQANLRHPGSFFYDNSIMGIMIMEESRHAGTSKFVSVGTVCAYPKNTIVPFSEEDLWLGYPEESNAPYGLAKKMLLVQGQAYRKEYGFNAIYLLPANLYGPGDNFDPATCHVIPALIQKFLHAIRSKQSTVEIWGDGTASREFLFVEDCALAIKLATENYNQPEPVNIGTGQEISIKALAELIAKLTGFEGNLAFDKAKPNGQPRRSLDIRRAEHFFAFKAQIPLETGLRETISWYQTHCDNNN
jgi:GDP-L-fucose synthase